MRSLVRMLLSLILSLGILLSAGHAWAHSVDASTLTLTEVADGKFAVTWQTLSLTLKEMPEKARYPAACQLRDDQLDCGEHGLVGTIEIPWLEGTQSHVMLVINWRSALRQSRILTSRSPKLTIYEPPSAGGLSFLLPVAVDFTRLGIEHILSGFDHLMFVLAITILVRGRKSLIAAITAFTIAHSLTLAATVFELVSLPSAPVETSIALSIVLVCAECLLPANSLTHRAPWLVTFVFGLLHGMGFASALLETGLPEQHVPAALLFFNVGVEIGQLMAIALFITVGWAVSRIEKRPAWLNRAFVYTMGTTAAYWSIERGVAMFAR